MVFSSEYNYIRIKLINFNFNSLFTRFKTVVFQKYEVEKKTWLHMYIVLNLIKEFKTYIDISGYSPSIFIQNKIKDFSLAILFSVKSVNFFNRLNKRYIFVTNLYYCNYALSILHLLRPTNGSRSIGWEPPKLIVFCLFTFWLHVWFDSVIHKFNTLYPRFCTQRCLHIDNYMH